MKGSAAQRPSFQEALRFWLRLGWISFGGTAAHIAIMHDELVEKKRWISNARFLNALSHCMILPGPEAQQLAIYIGWKLHGKRGGIVAGTLFLLPSMFILLALSVVYARFGSLPGIAALFNGLKPAVIALVIVALQRVARTALRGAVQIAAAVATFAAIFFFDVSLLVLMLAAVVVGIVLGTLWPGFLRRPSEAGAEEDEESYYIRRSSTTAEPVPLLKPALMLTTSVLFLWLMPLMLFYFFVADCHFWRDLALFFHQDHFRDRRRFVYGHSLRGAGCGVEAAPADEFGNDGRFRTGRDNSRPSDHSGSFCRVPSRLQPLPRLIVDGHSGFAGNDFLYVSAMLLLRLCRRAASGADPEQTHD